jgi:hypothetical protein
MRRREGAAGWSPIRKALEVNLAEGFGANGSAAASSGSARLDFLPPRDRMRMFPAIAVRHFMAPIGCVIADRTVTRNDQVTSAIAGPGAGVGVHAFAGASLARLRQGQHTLDHRTVEVVNVLDRRFEHQKRHGIFQLVLLSKFAAVSDRFDP